MEEIKGATDRPDNLALPALLVNLDPIKADRKVH